MKTNRNLKDSVFTTLFSDPDILRDLYCALGSVSLPPDVPVSINTLENVIYMDFYNDISFEIGGKLIVLIEHQSTINPNMAMRLFMYIGRVLEKRIEGRSLYSGKSITVPWPEFYVLYNGKKPYPERQTLRLSDLFEKPQLLGLTENTKPLLELEVQVININEGQNEELVNRCRKLAEYTAFVAKANHYLKKIINREEAIKETVKYCLKYDILKEFLEIHASEVSNMLLEEWNLEDAKKVWWEEAREDGLEVGLAIGRQEGRQVGHAEAKHTIARNLLTEGSTPEFIHKITGLSLEEIAKL